MAFDEKELVLMSEGPALAAGGPPMRVYGLKTNDNATAVQTNGYLDGALNNGINAGDHIIASLNMGGTPSGRHYICTTGGADVTLVNLDT